MNMSLPDRIQIETPSYIEHGTYLTKVKTTRGKATARRVALAVPESLYSRWATTGVGLVGLFVACWLVILTITAGVLIAKAAPWVLSLAWLDLLVAPSTPSAPEVDVARVLFEAAVGYLAYCVAFAILFPGIVLHEFGHFMAIVRNGGSVESYGLLFLGPVPMGAFVEPADELDGTCLSRRSWLEIASGGIVNNVGWGIGLAAVAATIFVVSGVDLWTGVHAAPLEQVGVLLLVLGVVEVLMGVSNAVPHPKLDGGIYLRSLFNSDFPESDD